MGCQDRHDRKRGFTGCSTLGLILGLGLAFGSHQSAILAAPATCDGDANGDRVVDFGDINSVLGFWLTDYTPGTGPGDANENGIVDFGDINSVLGFWLQVCPEYRGNPNPNEPGEAERTQPEGSGCSSTPWLRSKTNRWINGLYLFSGEAYQVKTDMVVRGRMMDFVWTRKFRSQVGPDTAQGNGWDFSYNIFLEASGGDLLLHNGFARSDLYALQPGGTWEAPEFFREIEQLPDSSYLVHFPDTGHWALHPLDASAAEGKIEAIVDRNGNTMSFAYDGAGRLMTVTDDLGRSYTVAYNVNGFIDSVTDFTARQVVYEYYNDGDADGSAGDLKSARSPIVTGTPNGNDFLLGKKTVYAYSTGFSDDHLNHNLLSITDPKGQAYLSYEYALTTDPLDPTYDHVVRQTWGDPGDLIDLHYEPVAPAPANNMADIQVVLNDRMGHVKELFYDSQNHGVMCREYTGLADPDLPTTLVDNRPTGQLRPGDPVLYETRWGSNPDSLVTNVLFPNLNELIHEHDELNLAPTARGNLLTRRRLPGPLGGDQVEIVETLEYEPGFGGCCGTNFVTRHVDGRGNETLRTYDLAGNRQQTTHRIPTIVETREYNAFGQVTAHVLPDNGSVHNRRDEFTYYAIGPQRGYLQSKIVDATGFALTTVYEYNPRGLRTRLIDPRGNDLLYTLNQLDQIVRRESREVSTAGGSIRYGRDTHYDANDNVVRVDIDNIDGDGSTNANAQLTKLYDYDVLNYRIRTSREVDPGHNVVTEYEYDDNRKRTLTRFGEATDGNQPTNTVRRFYDERDLVFQRIRGDGSPEQSSDQYAYDGNRNRIVTALGLELAPRITTSAYDGYDRLTSRTDPMGNVSSRTYDLNSNVLSARLDGELLDVPGSIGNVRLRENVTIFDDMDRVIQTDVHHFVTDTQAPIGDGLATTTTTWSDNSQILSTTNDNGHTSTTSFDTANRPRIVTDAAGNTLEYIYDANNNILSTTSTELSDLGSPAQQFADSFAYDALDRAVSSTDNIGNSNSVVYDSRSNRVESTDALRNRRLNGYDGLDRLLSTTTELTDTGDGGGVLVDTIVTQKTWDDLSRLVSRTDDNGNVTVSTFDSLNRETRMTCADGTIETTFYDVQDNITQKIDQNGTVTVHQYDLRDRLIRSQVVLLAPGVSNDVLLEEFSYDGRSRLVRASDEDATVERAYDSLSNVLEDRQNGQAMKCEYDGTGNDIFCIYPGGRQVTRQYDALERLTLVSDQSGMIADYNHMGPWTSSSLRGSRVERIDFGNGTRAEYEYDGITGIPNAPGDFGVKRTIRSTHTHVGSGTIIDDREYRWDQMQNKLSRKDLDPFGPKYEHRYEYDSAYRLTNAVVLDANLLVERDEEYDLDGVHNRTLVTGGSNPGMYTMNATLPQPADRQMNQYSQTSFDVRRYDHNGNLTLINPMTPQARIVRYDYRNRLVEYVNVVSGVSHTYQYDPLGRRITRTLDADGVIGVPQETRYIYDGWQVIEEQDAANITLATYVYGLYVDEVLTMECGGADYYFHQDDLFNVMALTDAAGVAVERYDYADYGRPLDPATLNPIVGNPSPLGNPYFFTGRRYDPETQWYFYRTRYMDPRAGRFTSRDTIGIWGSSRNDGNGYAYVANSPWSKVDPSGRKGDHAGFVRSVMLPTAAVYATGMVGVFVAGLGGPEGMFGASVFTATSTLGTLGYTSLSWYLDQVMEEQLEADCLEHIENLFSRCHESGWGECCNDYDYGAVYDRCVGGGGRGMDFDNPDAATSSCEWKYEESEDEDPEGLPKDDKVDTPKRYESRWYDDSIYDPANDDVERDTGCQNGWRCYDSGEFDEYGKMIGVCEPC